MNSSGDDNKVVRNFGEQAEVNDRVWELLLGHKHCPLDGSGTTAATGSLPDVSVEEMMAAAKKLFKDVHDDRATSVPTGDTICGGEEDYCQIDEEPRPILMVDLRDDASTERLLRILKRDTALHQMLVINAAERHRIGWAEEQHKEQRKELRNALLAMASFACTPVSARHVITIDSRPEMEVTLPKSKPYELPLKRTSSKSKYQRRKQRGW